jgi:predicted  nucleic acid-binding Zn-ribbon protein
MLQAVEQEIAAEELALSTDRSMIGESQALLDARAEVSEAQSEMRSIQSEQRVTEDAIADISAKIVVAEESLYSGRIKNPKELQALQQEIEIFKRQRDPLEDTDLNLMEKAEAAETRIIAALKAREQATAVWQGEQEQLESRIKLHIGKLKELEARREQAESGIPGPEINLYRQLKSAKGDAVSRMEQGTCGRCRMILSSAEVQRARAGHQVCCSSCGRLLFYE